MNKILATSLLAMSAALSAPSWTTALAQETVTINGVEATRIVIPPAGSDLARTIKYGLREAYYGATRDTRAWNEAKDLYFFYAERRFEPLWLDEQDGKVVFSDAAQKIIGVFDQAQYQGFRTEDYITGALDIGAAEGDPARMAALETAFSDAVNRYAHDAVAGRINPRDVSTSIDIRPRSIDQGALLVELAAADNPDEILLGLHPGHREFVALREALRMHIDGDIEEIIQVPDGSLIKSGMTDDRVPLLRQRLQIDPPTGEDALIYDETIEQAVLDFQESLGLSPDGVVGPATIAALNGVSGATPEDIVANMERWRWMPEDLGDFYVFVNVPEYRLEVHRGDTVSHATRVVVGQPKHRTPIFHDEIEHIVVNPYWNVPSSIARNELMPNVMANPGYLAARNYELVQGGRVVSASAVDWASVNPSNPPFRIRQRPGGGNALGNVKFLFPNHHAVYLHDTPSKSLFSRSYRAYSHGCIRVQNPMEFADALLANEPTLTAAGLQSMVGGGSERWNNLQQHVPVYLSYFTLRANDDGTLRSFADVYGHHKRMVALLEE
jgi:murein L,D-transpeptidase YcbB/YkuD